MPQREWIRLAGWAGITAVVLYIVGFSLYLAAGSPPDFTDAPKFTTYVHEHAMLIIAAASLNLAL